MKTLIIQHIQFPLMAIGLYQRYLIGRRRFNRRSMAGVQGFKNYSYAVLIMTIETVFKYIANVIVLTGIILLL
ncbi:hypothetical protein [Mucilaginibacter paludis]|uniref:Uncharacterized protein n=1 Tax=Mucilaginibacter paludis DSM 18603 TaxID=714943 RepID=H1XZ56_9SPHI|nr:hypothetical protein [Mucilaginibacter paludis]EHQ24641.1 hypothetical protein Mucpa_0447 [Mucilaginibacter paludis DSM 18603]